MRNYKQKRKLRVLSQLGKMTKSIFILFSILFYFIFLLIDVLKECIRELHTGCHDLAKRLSQYLYFFSFPLDYY